MTIKALLPLRTRTRLRRAADNLFSREFSDKETIGDNCPWTILVRDLNPESVVYSGGVGDNITFELSLIERFGVTIHIFDPSPVAAPTIKKATESHQVACRLFFKPLGLTSSENSSFSIGGDIEAGTWYRAAPGVGTVDAPCTNLPRELAENGDCLIHLLKLDIEGFEYGVLDSCMEHKIEILQICVEFHDFFDDIPLSRTLRAISKLRSHGFRLIHKHMNDYTFYNVKYLP